MGKYWREGDQTKFQPTSESGWFQSELAQFSDLVLFSSRLEGELFIMRYIRMVEMLVPSDNSSLYFF